LVEKKNERKKGKKNKKRKKRNLFLQFGYKEREKGM